MVRDSLLEELDTLIAGCYTQRTQMLSLALQLRPMIRDDGAFRFLIDLYDIANLWDDIIDNELNPEGNVNGVMLKLVTYNNSFYRKHRVELVPAIEMCFLKWEAANQIEKGKANAKSYMLRAGYFDLVLQVIKILEGVAAATKVASLPYNAYGEEFEKYLEESNA